MARIYNYKLKTFETFLNNELIPTELKEIVKLGTKGKSITEMSLILNMSDRNISNKIKIIKKLLEEIENESWNSFSFFCVNFSN